MQKALQLAVAAFFTGTVSVYAGGPESAGSSASDAVAVVSDSSGAAVPADAAPAGVRAGQPDVRFNDVQGTVEMHVNGANLVEVLRMLSTQAQRNIIASKSVRGSVTANLYGVTIKQALDAILRSCDCGYREEGNFIYVYTNKELADLDTANRQTQSRVFHLNYVSASDADAAVQKVLSRDGKSLASGKTKSGVAFDNTSAGGNDLADGDYLVVIDYPDVLDRVATLIKEIDRRPVQVLVEATILQASLNESNQLGINFTALGGVDFHSLANVGSSGSGSGLSQALAGDTTNAAAAGGIANNVAAGHIADKGFVAGSIGGSGLSLGVVTNNMSVFINALEGVTDTVVLANPKVLVLNKQKGEFKVIRKDPYFGAITNSGESSLQQQQVQFQESGTKLVLRPFATDDGYIRLEIHPEDSSVAGTNANNLPPTQNSTEATTNVIVKDGRTIVIGGLFREVSVTDRSGVPGLADMPFIGPLFRKQADETVRQEIIILLTPHIVKDDEAFAKASDGLMDDVERIRVGVRKGMMPWGRERLAELNYEWAMEELKKPKPNTDKALWNLNCATNLNPKFEEAILLKERLTGEVVQDVDNSSIRGFVRQQILIDPGPVGSTQVPATQPAPTTLGRAAPAKLPFPVMAAAPSHIEARLDAPTSRPSILGLATAPTTRPGKSVPDESALTLLPTDFELK
ncbi:MAG: type II secretion system protein GspD [Tepidisphaeraceae bacterium]